MKLKQIFKIVLSVIGILILLMVLTVLFWLGPTLELVAETIGPKALGTSLKIEKFSINPFKGTVHLTDFSIKNPDTFGQSNAVSLASMDIAIEMSSLFSSTIVVHQVELNSPYFIYEQGKASDNISEFILSIEEFAGIDRTAPPKPKKEEKKPKKDTPAKIVIVESLKINDVKFLLANTEDSLLDIGVGFESLSVSMTNGNVQLDNLFISNPGRLETPNLFSLEQFEILLEPGSVYSTNVTIHAVNIRKPHAFVEHNPETDTLGEFLKIASTLAAKIPANAPTATNADVLAEDSAEPPPPPPEVTLETLTIDDVQFHVVDIGDPDLSVHLGLNQLVVALTDGSINLDQLFLTNPKRLDTPNLFSLDGISIDFEPDSLTADTLVINDIQVRKPHAFLELNKQTDTVTELMKIANGFLERIPSYPIPALPEPAAGSGTELTEPPSDAVAAAPPIELHNLLVDDIQIKLLDTTPTNNIPDEPHMLAGIGAISIKLVDGNVQIKGITVPNIPGFLATNLFHLANIDISIDPASLFSDQVIINKVFINSPEINLEQTEESGNVAQLQTQLMQFAPPAPEETDIEEEPTEQAEEPESEPILLSEQPVILHQLLVTNLAINLKLPVETNETSGVIGSTVSMLNPMDKLSLKKLNPLAGDDDEEEPDPDAPVALVAFDQLSLEPLKGMLGIVGLRISNPPGFSKRNLVMIEEFRIDLDQDTLQADTLIIEDILIARPHIRYERQIMSDNIKALQEEIEQATTRRKKYMNDEEKEAAEKAEAIAKAEEEKAADEDDGQKVIIEHLLITSGKVQAKLSIAPATPPIPLPNIELEDIGKEKGGASAAEASTQVFDTFYSEVVGVVGNATGFAGDALKGVGNLGMGALGSLTGTKTNATTVVEESAEEPAEEPAEDEDEEKTRKRRIGGRRSAAP